jgi:hypothetical protein
MSVHVLPSSGILYTWTGFGKMVHTRACTWTCMYVTCMYIHACPCTYNDMHVHTCMSLYIQWHACIYMHVHVHACMYTFQYSKKNWQHPSCKLLLEPCCIHNPSTVSHTLDSNPSKITIYSLTWYIGVHTSIYLYVQCTDTVCTGMYFLQVHNHTSPSSQGLPLSSSSSAGEGSGTSLSTASLCWPRNPVVKRLNWVCTSTDLVCTMYMYLFT